MTNTAQDQMYIRRCLDIARLGKGNVSPNPMVGAVIVYQSRIIGEGYHMAYGNAHAEVNAINSIAESDYKYLKSATIYVSLEPCCIHGNTPPCTSLIIKHQIPRVIFSSIDMTPDVSGKSIEILKSAGCEVEFGILKAEGDNLVKFRNTFAEKKRPYVILKWAQSIDGFIGQENKSVWLTNSFSKRMVHKWRSETDAILIGTNTAETDNPMLTNRLYFGHSPLRIVLDKSLRLNRKLHLYDNSVETWIITEKSIQGKDFNQLKFVVMDFGSRFLERLFEKIYQSKRSSLIVEGGSKLLESFLRSGYWDEARVLIADRYLVNGIPAPVISQVPEEKFCLDRDQILLYKNRI